MQCLISVLCDQAKELKMKGESEVNNIEGNQNIYENDRKLIKSCLFTSYSLVKTVF